METAANPGATSGSSAKAVPWLSLTADEVARRLESDLTSGLSADEAARRLQAHGLNALAEAPGVSWWVRLVGQFKDLVIWILIAAAIISGIVGDWVDVAAILAIVALNGAIGFFQEQKAERALSALQKHSAPTAKVIRDGSLVSMPAREIVPGDLVHLESGDHVPADARLTKGYGLHVQESALTGESVPVEKHAEARLDAGTPLADRRNMVFMGTVVASGKASAIVVETGMATQLGHIAGMLQRRERETTPLQRRLTELGKVLVVVCLVLVAVIFVLNLMRGGQFLHVLLVSISLAVAAVPEGLPAVVTITLALGVQRLARRKALVRKLPSVETLGSVTVICSDKTGTLTRNEMTVREILAGGRSYEVTGAGYAPQGRFYLRRGEPAATDDAPKQVLAATEAPADPSAARVDPEQDPDLIQALQIAARCNNARLNLVDEGADKWQVVGDPTEGALLVAAMKAGIDVESESHIVYEIPFESERKAMSVVVREGGSKLVLYTKGAPEVILAKCAYERRAGKAEPLTDEARKRILHEADAMASRALRVLSLAYRENASESQEHDQEENLVFAGLAGMLDLPRDEALVAVDKCRAAGIRPMMITGDHPATALAIARELKIAEPGERVVTGAELDGMAEAEFVACAAEVSVFARVSAEHKLRLVEALKQLHQVVAMTGDGVNDAPAVKAADIGIAMGITGTDVTKEASDMVLMDDNFASIVNAVEEGRGIFDNIQKFIYYLLSTNAAEVLLMLIAALLNWPVPLLAIHILWINLVTDSLPALALGVERPEPDIMRRPPRPPREAVITVRRGIGILGNGMLIAAVASIGFWLVYKGQPENLPQARIVTFCVLAFGQILFSIGCRSQRYTMPQLGAFSNPRLFAAIGISLILQAATVLVPVLRPIFEVQSQLTWEWLLVIGLALVPVTVIEVFKLVRAKVAGLQAR